MNGGKRCAPLTEDPFLGEGSNFLMGSQSGGRPHPDRPDPDEAGDYDERLMKDLPFSSTPRKRHKIRKSASGSSPWGASAVENSNTFATTGGPSGGGGLFSTSSSAASPANVRTSGVSSTFLIPTSNYPSAAPSTSASGAPERSADDSKPWEPFSNTLALS